MAANSAPCKTQAVLPVTIKQHKNTLTIQAKGYNTILVFVYSIVTLFLAFMCISMISLALIRSSLLTNTTMLDIDIDTIPFHRSLLSTLSYPASQLPFILVFSPPATAIAILALMGLLQRKIARYIITGQTVVITRPIDPLDTHPTITIYINRSLTFMKPKLIFSAILLADGEKSTDNDKLKSSNEPKAVIFIHEVILSSVIRPLLYVCDETVKTMAYNRNAPPNMCFPLFIDSGMHFNQLAEIYNAIKNF